jgi:hypothetical protein
VTYIDPGQLALAVPAPPSRPVQSDLSLCLASSHHGVIVASGPAGRPVCALCAPTTEGRPS